jgi:arsenate reductase-like glutaredoxin family protein
MSVQIIGTKKCPDTRKAERFFKERGVQVHLLNLSEKPLSPGEVESITRRIDPDELIDRDSKTFRSRGLAYMVFDPVEEILKYPLLIRTPVVRMGSQVSVGHTPELWQQWLESS